MDQAVNHQDVSYETELDQAIQRNREWGLNCPPFLFKPQRLLTPDFINRLIGTQRYRPQLVGTDYFQRIGAIVEFPNFVIG